MKIFGFSGMVMGSLFKKPATKMYPIKKQEYKKITRGHIENEIEKCIFCGICEKKCPCDAIKVTKENREWSILRLRCIQCNACVEACPKKCLLMENSYTSPSVGTVKDVRNARVPDNTADNQESK